MLEVFSRDGGRVLSCQARTRRSESYQSVAGRTTLFKESFVSIGRIKENIWKNSQDWWTISGLGAWTDACVRAMARIPVGTALFHVRSAANGRP